MTKERQPYAECPQCGSAAVLHPNDAAGRRLYRCTRCRFTARRFVCAAAEPVPPDGRPRDGGRVLPIFRERD